MKIKRYHLVLLVVFALLSACSPRSSYMVLSFFFDGVPDHSKKEVAPIKDTARLVKPQAVVLTLPIVPTTIYHKPYAERNCDACHEKGVNNRSLKDQPGVCYACHKDFKEKYQYVHGPVAGGYCTACHLPHQADAAGLLKRHGQQICLKCHSSSQIMKNSAHAGIGTSDCTKCHNPHGGANRYVLK